MQRSVVLAAGAITAAVVVAGRRRKQRNSSISSCYAEQQPGKQQRQVVHAFSSPATAPCFEYGTAPKQAADAAGDVSFDSQTSTTSINRSYAYACLLLLASLAVAVYTVVVLLLRGQTDLAAAAALTWLFAAPAVLSLGKQQAAMAAAHATALQEAASEAADATMVITEAEPPTKVLAHFHGTWIKDAAASSSMDAAMRIIHLNALMRQAVKLIRGVQLCIDEDRFRFSVFSAISWFKVSEFFPWSGEVAENRRRDMRRGRAHGQVQVTPQGTIKIRYSWDNPHSGQAMDEFSIDEQGRLQLRTVVNVAGDTASYTQVYRRKSHPGEL